MNPHFFLFRLSSKHILPVVAIVLMVKTSSCTKSSTQPGVNYTGSGMLSEEGVYSAAAAGNKILFAGGYDFNANALSKTVDIFDVSSGTWSTTQLSEARGGLAGAGTGNKILFGGGIINRVFSKTVDIYDVTANSWTTAQLSVARNWLVAAAAGNKVLFAGGVDSSYGASKVVDIYDVLSNTWSTARLSEARFVLAAGAAGNKILFAGGAANIGCSKTVDIYDVLSNTWTIAQLSEARSSLAGGGVGNKVLFAGGLGNTGVDSKTVDIYNVSSNSWTTARLSEARENLTAATAGNKILFGGGNTVHWLPGGSGNIVDSGASKTVDIFDVSSNAWAATQLSEARENPAAAGSGNKILFAGGSVLDSAFDASVGIVTSFYRFPKTVEIFTLR